MLHLLLCFIDPFPRVFLHVLYTHVQSSSKKRGTIRNKVKVSKGKKRGKSGSKKSAPKSGKN